MEVQSRPAIVVIAYNRSDCLERLLLSLTAATYSEGGDVPLVISIDKSSTTAALEMAERFEWTHGPKRIIAHPENLGLREHVLSCGDLSEEYGTVIVFEDDLVAAPHFYAFVEQAAAFYDADDRVGGIGLYSYKINEFNNLNFLPIVDGSDVHFLQVAASWGQAWTKAQWAGFKAWYATAKDEPIHDSQGVPRQLEAWAPSSWKKYYIKYLALTDRYFVFPNAALATNRARPGTHTTRPVNIYQVPLDLGPRDWNLKSLANSAAIYDVYYEPKPQALRKLAPWLESYDFEVDIMGQKPAGILTKPYLISTRPCSDPVRQFALEMIPLEANLAFDIPGDFISLGRRESFQAMTPARELMVIRHLNLFAYWNKYFFQIFKPIQTSLQILRKRVRQRG